MCCASSGATSGGTTTSSFRLRTGSDRAIVTAVAGTTRDLLRETIEIGKLPVTIIDTVTRKVTHTFNLKLTDANRDKMVDVLKRYFTTVMRWKPTVPPFDDPKIREAVR